MRLYTGQYAAGVVVAPVRLGAPGPEMLAWLARQPDPAILESSALHPDFGRYTILACRPLEMLILRDGLLQDRDGKTLAQGDDEIWRALDHAFKSVRLAGRPDNLPYLPGWIGYVGYEIGRHIERLPGRAVRDTALPDLRLGFYDALMIYDALEHSWQLAELEFDSPPPGAGAAAKALRELVRQAQSQAPGPPPAPADHADARPTNVAGPISNFTPQAYRQAVQRCIDYIAAGDIFQVNLSQRLRISPAPDPVSIYQVLRRRNPAWYSAFLSFDSIGGDGRAVSCAIVSSSPELFLRLRGRHVLTRPIKGTRPRCGDASVDQAAMDELCASPKDNAELAMIIDLLRNDLGRVCRYGSVRVTERRTLETHPTVFHLVGTVQGELTEDVGVAGLLRATLPGGSITGAPKIRAMEIIDELEPQARGVYTGCVGIVGVDGSCEWNIAIRTVVCQGRDAYVQVGGGIVADSSPQGEYQETLDKARALLEAIAQARDQAQP